MFFLIIYFRRTVSYVQSMVYTYVLVSVGPVWTNSSPYLGICSVAMLSKSMCARDRTARFRLCSARSDKTFTHIYLQQCHLNYVHRTLLSSDSLE